MRYRPLGDSGLMVSEVALGSWLTIGSSIDEEASGRVLRVGLDRGINLIDTADVYALGEAETVLGATLRGLPRKDYVLASKCYFPTGDGPNDRGLSRKHVFESLDASLRRLRTDYLDLYQCHRFDEETPLAETVRAMTDLIALGKIHYWGVSCWTAEQIEHCSRLCDELSVPSPIANQPPYNLFERGIEESVLPCCAKHGLGLIVFSPLAQGVLTGKYAAGSPPPDGSRAADDKHNRFIGRFMSPEHLDAAAALSDVARECGLSLAAFSLRWCLRRGEVTSVIVGATRPEQLEDNLRACDGDLPIEAVARAESIVATLPQRR